MNPGGGGPPMKPDGGGGGGPGGGPPCGDRAKTGDGVRRRQPTGTECSGHAPDTKSSHLQQLTATSHANTACPREALLFQQ